LSALFDFSFFFYVFLLLFLISIFRVSSVSIASVPSIGEIMSNESSLPGKHPFVSVPVAPFYFFNQFLIGGNALEHFFSDESHGRIDSAVDVFPASVILRSKYYTKSYFLSAYFATRLSPLRCRKCSGSATPWRSLL
jgi:hypothetical protein